MKRQLNIAIADDDIERCEYLSTVLPQLGHNVVCVATNGQQLVDQCRQAEVDLVITDAKMPKLDGIEAVMQICQERPVPAILVSAYHDDVLKQRAAEASFLAYLVKPVKRDDLETAIDLVMPLFDRIQGLTHTVSELQETLADRKLIERAKGIMMKWTGLSEEQAFRRLQRMSRDKNRKLVEIAKMVISLDKGGCDLPVPNESGSKRRAPSPAPSKKPDPRARKVGRSESHR